MNDQQKLEFHPEAEKKFNEKAENLLLELIHLSTQTDDKSDKPKFHPDSYVEIISEKDIIGEMKFGKVNYAGQEVAKFFMEDGKHVGLNGVGYRKMLELAETMQKTKSFRNKVSVSLILESIFDWIKNKHTNKTTDSITNYVINNCASQLKDFEIWIPIAMTHMQSELRFGKVTIKTITKEIIDKWLIEWKASLHEDSDKIEQLFMKERKDLQGLAVATINLFAEPKRAIEIAFIETEKTISLLRFFSPANFFPEMKSYCTPLGQEKLETIKHLVIQNNKLVRIEHKVVDKSTQSWEVDNRMITGMREGGLDILNELLIRDSLTDFQRDLLNSLILYSKNCLQSSFAEKLIYILVALESILLRNEDEPIEQNIGERIAFLIG